MKSGFYAGSTLLDDGRPVLLLDVTNIAGMHDLVSDARTRVLKAGMYEDQREGAAAMRAMLFTDFAGRRSALRLELVKRIETAPASAIDRSTGTARAVIDGVILPLVGLPDGPLEREKVRLLRLSDGACELLYAVAEVDDAVELIEPLKPVEDDPLVEAITLVAGRTVTLLDGHELFARHGEPPEPADRPIARLPDSDWARTILAPLVTSAGYEIAGQAASDEKIALTIMFDETHDAADAIDRPVKGPVIRLSDRPDSVEEGAIYRYDREKLIEALHRARDRGRTASAGAGAGA
jgi:two-component system chemotaxis sensor kinase CheA